MKQVFKLRELFVKLREWINFSLHLISEEDDMPCDGSSYIQSEIMICCRRQKKNTLFWSHTVHDV